MVTNNSNNFFCDQKNCKTNIECFKCKINISIDSNVFEKPDWFYQCMYFEMIRMIELSFKDKFYNAKIIVWCIVGCQFNDQCLRSVIDPILCFQFNQPFSNIRFGSIQKCNISTSWISCKISRIR